MDKLRNYIKNILLEEFGDKIIVYHGTSSNKLDLILNEYSKLFVTSNL